MGFFEGGWMWFSLGLVVTLVVCIAIAAILIYLNK